MHSYNLITFLYLDIASSWAANILNVKESIE